MKTYTVTCPSTNFQTHFEVLCFHTTTSFPPLLLGMPSSPFTSAHIRHITAALCCHCHITAQVHHHPCWPPCHPEACHPSMPLLSLGMWAFQFPPKRPRHGGDDKDAMSSTTPTPMTMLKSMIFAMGWKGQMRADLEQAKTHKHQHQINTNLKNTNHMFYSVRGRLLEYAQNRSHRDFKSKVCNCLIELQ